MGSGTNDHTTESYLSKNVSLLVIVNTAWHWCLIMWRYILCKFCVWLWFESQSLQQRIR